MFNPVVQAALRARIRPSSFPTKTFSFPTRSLITLKDKKYTATATASGAGRNGHVESSALSLDLKHAKELGGNGTVNDCNPEQLFAMGYAGCLLGTIQFMAARAGKAESAKNAKVHASVHLGSPTDMEGYGLAVDITVEGIDDDAIIQAGHAVCPYSRALSRGAVVNISRA